MCNETKTKRRKPDCMYETDNAASALLMAAAPVYCALYFDKRHDLRTTVTMHTAAPYVVVCAHQSTKSNKYSARECAIKHLRELHAIYIRRCQFVKAGAGRSHHTHARLSQQSLHTNHTQNATLTQHDANSSCAAHCDSARGKSRLNLLRD